MKLKNKNIEAVNHEQLITPWFDGKYRVYCESYSLHKKISSWKDSEKHGDYYYPNGSVEYDLIIPEEYLERVKKLLKENSFRNRSSKESQTSESRQDPTQNDNNLQDMKSPYSDEKKKEVI